MAAPHLYNFTHDKAGMGGVDKSKVAEVVHEMSKDSRYFRNAKRHDASNQARIQAMKASLATASDADRAAAAAAVAAQTAELEASRDLSRVMVVVDLDMFFAAVEMRDRPELAQQPMAVGGMGMISTANYEARKYGVRSAMPGFIAKQLCPHLVFVAPNFKKYTAAAKVVRGIFARYDPAFRPASLDEAYLDITEYCKKHGVLGTARPAAGQPPPKQARMTTMSMRGSMHPAPPPADTDLPVMAEAERSPKKNVPVGLDAFRCGIEAVVAEMRAAIHAATGLTASAGIGPNPMLAKIASDMNKPNGQFFVPFNRQGVLDFMAPLPVRRIPFVGKVSESTLVNALGVRSAGDLLQHAQAVWLSTSALQRTFLLRCALGIADTSRDAHAAHRRKSVSQERTFRDCSDLGQLRVTIHNLAHTVSAMMRRGDPASGASWEFFGSSEAAPDVGEGDFDAPPEAASVGSRGAAKEEVEEEEDPVERVPYKGRTLTLKLKRGDFKVFSRQVALPRPTDDPETMASTAMGLLEKEAVKASTARRKWKEQYAGQAQAPPQPPALCLRLIGVRMSNLVFADEVAASPLTKFLQQAPKAAPGQALAPAPPTDLEDAAPSSQGSVEVIDISSQDSTPELPPSAGLGRLGGAKRTANGGLPCPLGVLPSVWTTLPKAVQRDIHSSLSRGGSSALRALSGR